MLRRCFVPYCTNYADLSRNGNDGDICRGCDRVFCAEHFEQHNARLDGTFRSDIQHLSRSSTCNGYALAGTDSYGLCDAFSEEYSLDNTRCCRMKNDTVVQDRFLPFVVRRSGHRLPPELLQHYLERMVQTDMVDAAVHSVQELVRVHMDNLTQEHMDVMFETLPLTKGHELYEAWLQERVPPNDIMLHLVGQQMLEDEPICILPETLVREMTSHGMTCLMDGSALCPVCSPSEVIEGYGHLLCGADLRDVIMQIPLRRDRAVALVRLLYYRGRRLSLDQMDTIEVFIPPTFLGRYLQSYLPREYIAKWN